MVWVVRMRRLHVTLNTRRVAQLDVIPVNMCPIPFFLHLRPSLLSETRAFRAELNVRDIESRRRHLG